MCIEKNHANHVDEIEIRYGILTGNEKLASANEAAVKTRIRDIGSDIDGL